MSPPKLDFQHQYAQLILLLLIVPGRVFAQTASESVTFRDGTVLSCTVVEANAWALTLDDDAILPIKSLHEIRTSSLLLVEKLKSFYPELPVAEKDSVFTLSVTTLSLLPAPESNVVQRYFCNLYLMTARRENLEFQVNLVLRSLDNFIGQLSVSSGTDFQSQNYNLQQIAIGAGFIRMMHRTDIAAILSVAHKSRTFGDTQTLTDIVTFLSLYVYQRLGSGPFLVSLGGRYHFSNLPIENGITRFSGSIGVGFNFRSKGE